MRKQYRLHTVVFDFTNCKSYLPVLEPFKIRLFSSLQAFIEICSREIIVVHLTILAANVNGAPSFLAGNIGLFGRHTP